MKIYDDKIRTDSVYKSIIISRETTVSDTLDILLNCYSNLLDNHNIGLYETNTRTGIERLLGSEQCPLLVTEEWGKAENTESDDKRFVVKFRPRVTSSESVGPGVWTDESSVSRSRDSNPGM